MDITALVLTAITAVLALVTIVLLVVVLRSNARQQHEMEQLRRTAEQLTSSGDASGRGGTSDADNEDRPAGALESVGVVVNPSKFDDPSQFRRNVESSIRLAGISDVRFYETSPDDPGRGQALQAIEDGCDLVFAAGGDGTVRMVAGALASTDVRMAILPVGTGNLLARNIDVPLNSPEAAVAAALTGHDHPVDVGWLRTGMSEEEARAADKQVFLVMAGYGADAEMIGNTDPELKKRMGWIAYVVGGVRTILGRSQYVHVALPDGSRHQLKARTVIIGNVGKLPGGLVLMPDATIDNGRLEVLVAGWRGAAGFGQVVTKLVNPRLPGGVKLSTMERYLTASVRVATTKPQPVQLDGDTAAEATHMIATIDAGSLVLRVPSRH